MESLKFLNDPDVTPEDAVKILNALGAVGVTPQLLVKAAQNILFAAGITGNFTDATYDGTGRLTSYKKMGVLHTVSYPSSTSMEITNTNGEQRTVGLDGSGRVVSII